MAAEPDFSEPRMLHANESGISAQLHRRCYGSGARTPQARRPGEGETWVIASGKRLAAQATIYLGPLRVYDALLQVGSLSGLCTHPDFRGRGLAGRLLDFCAQRLRDQGAQLMLIPAAQGLVNRKGFTDFGRFAAFNLNGLGGYPYTSEYNLRRITKKDAIILSCLYHSEPVHFHRPVGQFAQHFRQERQGQRRMEEVIVEHLGRPVAYLMLDLPDDPDADPANGDRRLFEYAGSRRAVMEAINLLQAENRDFSLDCLIPWQDYDMIAALYESQQTINWETQPGYAARMLNFPALMAALEPYMRGRLDSTLLDGLRFEQTGPLLGKGGRCTILHGEECLTLETTVMTARVLGSAGEDEWSEGAGMGIEELSFFGEMEMPDWNTEDTADWPFAEMDDEPAGMDAGPDSEVRWEAEGIPSTEAWEEREFVEKDEGEEAANPPPTSAVDMIIQGIFPLPSFLPGLDGV